MSNQLKCGLLLSLFFTGLALLPQSTEAQSPALVCPKGSTPLPQGTTRDAKTGAVRNFACADAAGKVTLQPEALSSPKVDDITVVDGLRNRTIADAKAACPSQACTILVPPSNTNFLTAPMSNSQYLIDLRNPKYFPYVLFGDVPPALNWPRGWGPTAADAPSMNDFQFVAGKSLQLDGTTAGYLGALKYFNYKLEGNPTPTVRPSTNQYPAILGTEDIFNTGLKEGDLENLQRLQWGNFMVTDKSPSFKGELLGLELDTNLESSASINHILGFLSVVGPTSYPVLGHTEIVSGSTLQVSTNVRAQCHNSGTGFFGRCVSFSANALIDGRPGAKWGGWTGFLAMGPTPATAPNNVGVFTDNIFNFLSSVPATAPIFSSTNNHYFGMAFVKSSDPFTNDLWFLGGGWNNGHLLFGGNSNTADHVWWAGGKYGWETKEKGAPTSSGDFTYSTAMIDSRTNTLVMPRGRGGDPAIAADGTLTIEPEKLNLSPRGHGIVISNNSHLQQSAKNGDLGGRIALVSGSGSHTFSHSFKSPPVCVASDTAAANPVRVTTTATTMTVTGTSGDVVNYICIGNPN